MLMWQKSANELHRCMHKLMGTNPVCTAAMMDRLAVFLHCQLAAFLSLQEQSVQTGMLALDTGYIDHLPAQIIA